MVRESGKGVRDVLNREYHESKHPSWELPCGGGVLFAAALSLILGADGLALPCGGKV